MTALSPLTERTHILLGDEGLTRLANAHVFVAGLGGVGSYCAEALARAGVGRLTLLDHDVVTGSNLNRQLPALISTVGRKKIEVMAERIRDINPACELTLHEFFMHADDVPAMLAPGYDFVVDCIDSLNSKVTLLESAWLMKMKVASSMGAGGKLDPTRIRVTDLMKTEVCHLASFMRHRLRKRGVGKGILAVWSDEPPRKPLPPEPTDEGRPRAVNGTISYMPSLFGLTLAGAVINCLLEQNKSV
ncbi:MAG TPA: tRNA threonylcarbamoyladenosine dehydratase [Gammaproteobacteria bacterium]